MIVVGGSYEHPEPLLRRLQRRVAKQAGKANSPNLKTIDRLLTALDEEKPKLWTPEAP